MPKEQLLYQPTSKKQIWGQLYGSSLTLAVAEYCQKTPGIKLILAKDNLTASQIYDELPFFLNEHSPQELLFFRDWETLPYDQFSPHQDIISERLYCLYKTQHTKNAIIVSSVNTLMHRLCPVEFLNQTVFVLKKGQQLDLHVLRDKLQQAGYHNVSKVLEHGEFALRGSIMDVFPMGSKYPFRVELFDNEIESLRMFDTETQRTINVIDAINVFPAREFPLNERSQTLFRQNFRERFQGNPSQCPIYEAVSSGQYPSGIEYYLPLFFEKTNLFFDYLPDSAKLIYIENIQDNAEHFWLEAESRFSQRSYDVSKPILSPESCFIKATELLERANTYEQLRVFHNQSEKKGTFNFTMSQAPKLPIDRKSEFPLKQLEIYCTNSSNRHLLLVESAGRREVLLDLLRTTSLNPKTYNTWHEFLDDEAPIGITISPVQDGFVYDEQAISIITETELFGEQSTPQRKTAQKSIDPDLIIRSLAELRVNDPVVHLQFGVGRYQGLQYIESSGILNEFLVLHYAGNDKIYVPVTSLHMISRYTGLDSEHAPLHKLGTDQWQKAKKKALEKINDVAVELLDLYAKREAQPGFEYELNQTDYQKFASSFPFSETKDQIQAITQIINDMQSTKPMDRLICGDVGFGKTEVAMRAAYVAVQNSRQVCILAPTTLLAGQHFDSFKDRFAEVPVHIELLSRFRSAKESEVVLQGLASGKVDIVIGTHKLLQNPVQFKNLSLVIIDEEHRFGVKQKEHMKSLRAHVDILSMTATPIPRTLNMAMAGIRDISLIATPPAKRLAIKTFWHEKKDLEIREAILREILRGGQVFFLHNNVQTIEKITHDLQELVPEAIIKHAHGQMRERALEQIMSDFYHHRFNVLVCTTIIETGIDIPTANTIIIDRADKFGLAQLHQLRGRVGRSHHQAYAYLLTPPENTLSKDSIKRLEAIVSLEDLGAGFTLATHDLEIRGAGELLGDEQSGNMEAIGFSLYMEMLDKAVQNLKDGKQVELMTPLNQGPDIDFRISAIIPDDYIPDIHQRLLMYKKIAHATNKEQLHEVQVELIDRFGLLPKAVKYLLLITELKYKAQKLGVTKISVSNEFGKIDFTEAPSINPEVLISLIQVHAKRYKMEGPSRLKVLIDSTNTEERIYEFHTLLDKLYLPS